MLVTHEYIQSILRANDTAESNPTITSNYTTNIKLMVKEDSEP